MATLPATTASTYLHTASLLRFLAVMLLVMAPHFARIPWGETVAILAVLAWRAEAGRRRWRMPGKLVRGSLTLIAFAGVWWSYGRINGQHAGVALLLVMVALKLTEMNQRRDVMVTVFLLYFVCITHFLFSQEIWTLAYLLLAAVAVTAALIEANHAGEPLPPSMTLRRGGTLVAQALPLMLLMFVLFPRVPGPLWGLPSDSGASRSGLSDSMSPGDIASLIMSDELAFRVRFDGPVPPPNQRYWRGPVFWDFDGREWTEGLPALAQDAAVVELAGAPVSYEVVLEPHRALWLFALDVPDPRALPADSRMAFDGRLLAGQVVRERLLYRVQSHPDYRLDPQLSERARRAALRLPRSANPRARALAEGWRAQGLDDAAIVQTALRLFREQEFFYTLKPPLLGAEPVDEFLFETRRGFCEHYSSAFTSLMRAAGIPARVVTGYLGGRRNEVGEHYVVRQSDAHAWSEVWLEGRGWLRVDPTAAVAPNRVEQDLASALPLEESLPLNLRRGTADTWASLQARWDYANAEWNRWVLAYGPELQEQVLGRIGLTGWRDLMLALTTTLALALGVYGALAIRRALPVREQDAALAAWHSALKVLAREGLLQKPSEGPRAFAARVADEQPHLASAIHTLAGHYLAARYRDAAPDPAALRALRSAVGEFRRAARAQASGRAGR